MTIEQVSNKDSELSNNVDKSIKSYFNVELYTLSSI